MHMPLPLLNLSENWLLATYKTNLNRIHEKLLKVSARQINHVKCTKSYIFTYLLGIIERVQELDTDNMQNKCEQDTWKALKVIASKRYI